MSARNNVQKMNNIKIFEMAHQAIQTLKIASNVLTPREKETLELISDLDVLSDLQISLDESSRGKLIPFKDILKK